LIHQQISENFFSTECGSNPVMHESTNSPQFQFMQVIGLAGLGILNTTGTTTHLTKPYWERRRTTVVATMAQRSQVGAVFHEMLAKSVREFLRLG
jgi:hypothetical protein